MRTKQHRVLAVSLILFFVLLVPSAASASRYSALIVDADTGEVIFARNADKQRYPASLTKMMTLYLAFDALEQGRWVLDGRLTVSRRAEGQAPSKIGLRAGQTIRVKDAILALVTKSANDAATVVAENLADSEVAFARSMTEKARLLGMKQTTFVNASGLHNRHQMTTARDMATLAKALIQDFPQYYHYFATQRFKFGKRIYGNHNNLVGRYAGADGIKTGYISASGFNLVASAQRGPHRLIGVVLGGRTSHTRDRHMVDLLDRGFAELKRRRPLIASVPLPVRKPTLAAANDVLIAGWAIATGATEVSEMPPETGSAESPSGVDGWGIQVGAYSDLENARRRARYVASVLPGMLASTSTRIEAASENARAVYRARFVGLDQGEARRACGLLTRKRIDCLVIGPNGVVR